MQNDHCLVFYIYITGLLLMHQFVSSIFKVQYLRTLIVESLSHAVGG